MPPVQENRIGITRPSYSISSSISSMGSISNKIDDEDGSSSCYENNKSYRRLSSPSQSPSSVVHYDDGAKVDDGDMVSKESHKQDQQQKHGKNNNFKAKSKTKSQSSTSKIKMGLSSIPRHKNSSPLCKTASSVLASTISSSNNEKSEKTSTEKSKILKDGNVTAAGNNSDKNSSSLPASSSESTFGSFEPTSSIKPLDYESFSSGDENSFSRGSSCASMISHDSSSKASDNSLLNNNNFSRNYPNDLGEDDDMKRPLVGIQNSAYLHNDDGNDYTKNIGKTINLAMDEDIEVYVDQDVDDDSEEDEEESVQTELSESSFRIGITRPLKSNDNGNGEDDDEFFISPSILDTSSTLHKFISGSSPADGKKSRRGSLGASISSSSLPPSSPIYGDMANMSSRSLASSLAFFDDSCVIEEGDEDEDDGDKYSKTENNSKDESTKGAGNIRVGSPSLAADSSNNSPTLESKSSFDRFHPSDDSISRFVHEQTALGMHCYDFSSMRDSKNRNHNQRDIDMKFKKMSSASQSQKMITDLPSSPLVANDKKNDYGDNLSPSNTEKRNSSNKLMSSAIGTTPQPADDITSPIRKHLFPDKSSNTSTTNNNKYIINGVPSLTMTPPPSSRSARGFSFTTNCQNVNTENIDNICSTNETNHGVATHPGSSMASVAPYKIFILIIQPAARIFELIQVRFSPLTATIRTLIELIPPNCTELALADQIHIGFCRPELIDPNTIPPKNNNCDGSKNDHYDSMKLSAAAALTNFSAKACITSSSPCPKTLTNNGRIVNGEILVAIPMGYTCRDCQILARHILKNPKMIKLLSQVDPLSPRDGGKVKKKRRRRKRRGSCARSSPSKTSTALLSMSSDLSFATKDSDMALGTSKKSSKTSDDNVNSNHAETTQLPSSKKNSPPTVLEASAKEIREKDNQEEHRRIERQKWRPDVERRSPLTSSDPKLRANYQKEDGGDEDVPRTRCSNTCKPLNLRNSISTEKNKSERKSESQSSLLNFPPLSPTAAQIEEIKRIAARAARAAAAEVFEKKLNEMIVLKGFNLSEVERQQLLGDIRQQDFFS